MQLSIKQSTALISILVYTGHTLAFIAVITKIFSIDNEQLIIFFATLLVSLKQGLIIAVITRGIDTRTIDSIISNSAIFLLEMY